MTDHSTEAIAPIAPTEETDRGAWLAELRQQAADIRKTHAYEGSMTAALLSALGGLLYEAMPDAYIEFSPPTQGKPYPSTGIRSVQPQVDHMNAVLGAAHWRALLHFQDGGALCKTVVIIGDDLARASLDEHGRLQAGDAHVVAVQEGWGGVKRGNTTGDLMKGATTNALKRTLAAFGPGANVYRLDVEPELLGGVGRDVPAGGPSVTGAPASGLASDGQRKLISVRASQAGLADADLANIMLAVGGAAPQSYPDPRAASAFLAEIMGRLPKALVDPVLERIAAGPAAPNGAPSPAAPPMPVAPLPVSDITSEQDLAALAPSPVEMPAGRDSVGGYAQPDLGALGDVIGGQS